MLKKYSYLLMDVQTLWVDSPVLLMGRTMSQVLDIPDCLCSESLLDLKDKYT